MTRLFALSGFSKMEVMLLFINTSRKKYKL
jgi:hypothetical protein